MKRGARNVLHYSALSTRLDGHMAAWAGQEPSAIAMTAFDTQVDALVRAVSDVKASRKAPKPDKSAAKIMKRLASREEEWARRTALDLQRLEDLEERRQQRRAHALRQEWFIIGRVVADAMARDPAWRSRILPLLKAAPLTQLERTVLGFGDDG